jgi:GT2 family glycosyltransferase
MIDWLGYPFCRGRLFEHVEEDTGQYDDETSIFWASGAALAIRKDLFVKLEGFNEDFEFHMEEIDLCWRAWHCGQSVRYQPKSVVYHLGGGSLPMGSPRKVYYNYRNSLLMLAVNLQRWVAPKIFLRLCLDGIAGIRSFLQFKPRETFAIIRAHFGFYRRLMSALKKRSKLKAMQEYSPDSDAPMHKNLVIFEAFLKGKTKYTEL